VASGYVEPTRRVPLRWGTYESRYVGGILYVAAGTVIILSANTYTIGFLLLGTVAHCFGWALLPATGRRRLWAFWPSLLAIWLMLTGPQILFVMTAVLLGWLLVRERPLRTYVLLLFPILSGVIMANSFHSNHDEPLAFGVETLVVIACAWLARLLAPARSRRVGA
jgi:drug/metabolite transporter (DMT)-like permease